MRQKDFYYVCLDSAKCEVFTCGATFTEFYEFIPYKPQNILLLKADFWGGSWNQNTGFEYVEKEHLKDLLEDNVYDYGDFCWVDFNKKSSIDEITPVELSELLYASHKFQPLESPFFDRLDNSYTYLAHDDDYWTRIYIKDINSYRKVIEGKILKELKGRKRSIEPIPSNIIDFIYNSAKEGILIDFTKTYFSGKSTGVRIYKIGRHVNYDQIHDMYERKQNCLNNNIVLDYTNKKWKIYGEWK
ncbi:MAG: hypothetical protein GX383_03860 [Clostridium sp.]|nr:hypothetical protein [Clostridium sp.]